MKKLMKFDKGQEVVCVNSLDMDKTLIVGKTYKVEEFISLMPESRSLVTLEGIKTQVKPVRLIPLGHPNQTMIIGLYEQIRKLDGYIDECFTIESQTGDDQFWKREKLRGEIEEIEQVILEQRGGL